jgi:photosystem II stability/assembly factor-like uncharacterized protein
LRTSFVCLLAIAALVSGICSAQDADSPSKRTSLKEPQESEAAPIRTGHQEAQKNGDRDTDDPLSREEWFVKQRAWPEQHIPPGAYWRAQQQREALVARDRARSAAVASVLGPETAAAWTDPLVSATWTALGPEPLGGCFGSCEPWAGRTTSIAIDPTNDLTVYIGTAGGGVWKTINGGGTWKPLTDTRASLAIGAVAVDPNNHLTVFAGTGEAAFSLDSYFGQGLLKSTDGGNTWSLIRRPFTTGDAGPRFVQIAVQRGNSNVVLAATEADYSPGGLWRSADGGTTWKTVLAPDGTGSSATAVIFDTKKSTTAYAAVESTTAAKAVVYKSTDSGQTWAPIGGTGTQSLPAVSPTGRVALTETADGTTLYAAAANKLSDDNFGGPAGSIYVSTDAGAHWTNLGNVNTWDGSDWYRNAIAVDPVNPKILYVAGVNLYQSANGGKTWSVGEYDWGVYADQHAIAFSADGQMAYVADDGGVFSSKTPAAANPAFSSLNSTLGTMTYYPGFAVTSNPDLQVIAGAQDHGIDMYQGNLQWTETSYCGDGGAAYADASGNFAFVHCPGANVWAISPDPQQGFTNWYFANNGINPNGTDQLLWWADVKGDFKNPAIVYTATNVLYQSLDSGDFWQAISPDQASAIDTIAVAPSRPNTVYIGTANSIAVTQSALLGSSAKWTNYKTPSSLYLTKLIVAPTNPLEVYATFSGFGAGHVFHSTNSGSTWSNISGNLPDTPVNSIAIDPDVTGTLYLATDMGVYFTRNGGTKWTILGKRLPNVVAQDLLLAEPERGLYVVTHGRGVWNVPAPAIGLAPSADELTFAWTKPGAPGAAQTLNLTNNQQTGSLTLTAFAVTGPFKQTNNCPATLAAAASCTVTVSFTAPKTGALQGALTISSSANKAAVVLIANDEPVVSLSNTTFGFGNVPVNSRSVYTPYDITNTGTGNLTLSSVAIAGTNAADFLIGSNGCAGSIAPGNGCWTYLAFQPKASGARSATLTFTDNAQGSPHVVALTGIGGGTSKSVPRVTMYPSSNPGIAQNGFYLNVNVTPAKPGPASTGSVVVTCGKYASPANQLSTLQQGYTEVGIAFSPGALPADVLNKITVTYTPDATAAVNYTSAKGTGYEVLVDSAKVTPGVLVDPVPATVTTAQTATINVRVTVPAGKPAASGTVIVASGTWASAATAVSAGLATVTMPAGALPVGGNTIQAVFAPSSATAGAVSAAAGQATLFVNQASQ